MKKILKILALLILLGAAGIQAVRPDRANPREDPTRTLETVVGVPDDVGKILDRSCADCHSSRTRWPWYSNVAPVSWFLVKHVNDGRRHLNFSDFAALPVARQAKKLGGICKELTKGDMPLSSYLLLHRDAKVNEAEQKLVCDWATAAQARMASAAPKPDEPGEHKEHDEHDEHDH